MAVGGCNMNGVAAVVVPAKADGVILEDGESKLERYDDPTRERSLSALLLSLSVPIRNKP